MDMYDNEYLDIICDPECLVDYSKEDMDKLLDFIQQLESNDEIDKIKLDLEDQQFICKLSDSITPEEILSIESLATDTANSVGIEIDDVDLSDADTEVHEIRIAYIL